MSKNTRTKKEMENLKSWAKTLITIEGYSQKAAAQTVGVTPSTMNNWYKEGKWEELLKKISLTKPEQLANLYNELAALNNAIKLKPKGERYADSKEADARRKLLKDIEMLEKKASISDVIEICQELLEFTRKVSLKEAQLLSKYTDAFIKSKI